MELTAEQARVLGCLVEKELTTPQAYPLTDKALVAACNQTTNRDPVVTYDLAAVRTAVRSLRELGLVRTVHRTGERSDKHLHQLDAAWHLSAAQVAVLAVLLLRGPQTPGELRTRTDRMHGFATVEQLQEALDALAGRDEPLAAALDRQPGRKEVRWTAPGVAGQVPPSATEPPPVQPAVSEPQAGPADELAALRADVADLRSQVEELTRRLDG